MKIGIVTLVGANNYGNILQNYAMQHVLRQLGHEPLTLFRGVWLHIYLYDDVLRYILHIIKTTLTGEFKYHQFHLPRTIEQRGMRQFIKKHITHTSPRRNFSRQDVRRYGLDALLVGSDQTWRPQYVLSIEDMFLSFAEEADVLRMAYAASFGVGDWEFTPLQTEACSALVKKIKYISVREESGVKLCKEHLGVDAEWVLDPTMLLSRKDYEELCTDEPRRDNLLFAYILDRSAEKEIFVKRVAASMGLTPYITDGDIKSASRPERWLAAFRDAHYVITDSFHGTAFSLIFGVDFTTITNAHRGNARFESLQHLFPTISGRVVSPDSLSNKELPQLPPIDWEEIRQIFAQKRESSMDFLRRALKKEKTTLEA